jgi:hypothetical protein
VQFDTALNLLWLLLGLAALASTARAALRRTPRLRKTSAWLHVVGVALIVAALFPYISATDDVVRAEHFSAQHDRGHTGKHTRIDNLVRLYEAMDNPLLCEAREIALVLFFISLIFTPAIRAANRMVPRQAGRSPPSLSIA